MGTRRGITFIDLIVALTLAICLIPAAVNVVGRTHEDASRVECASNLKQIGQAILLYANENRNAYPRTRYNAETADSPKAWTGAATTRPFADDGPAENDVTAAYRLLLLTQDLVPEVFTDPTSPTADYPFACSPGRARAANFVDERELSYSFANPYPTAAVRDAGYRLTKSLSAEFAIAADINPGIAPPDSDVTAVTSTDSARNTRRGNSPNHDRDGQNVLYGDGHVEFQQSPYVGIARDNVYTFGALGNAKHGVVGGPVDPNDSVLLPTLDPARWQSFRERAQTEQVLWWVAGLLVVAALVGLLGWSRGKGESASPPPEWPPMPAR